MFAGIFAAVLYSPSGAFEKGKGALEGAKEIVPNISIGDKALMGGTPEVASIHRQEITNMVRIINDMLNSSKSSSDCFNNYGGFTDLGEDDGAVTISLAYNGVNGTQLTVNGGVGGKQIITDLREFFPNMRPCVIATGNIASNFYEKFIEGDDVSNYYKFVNSITIKYDFDNWNENRIDYDGSGPIDFEGHTWLFTPDNTHICFFPTEDGNAGCDGDGSEGLDDDCLIDTTEKTSVPYRINNGPLKKC